jgi:hypothetical protein
MRFYIATGLGNAAAHNQVRDVLHELGHEITYDWTSHGAAQDTPFVFTPEDAVKLRDVCTKELNGIMSAELLVVILPGGRGTHAELGMGLTMQAKCLKGHAPLRIILLDEAPRETQHPMKGERRYPYSINETGYTCGFYYIGKIETIVCPRHLIPWESIVGRAE